jgi:hypothetical protein
MRKSLFRFVSNAGERLDGRINMMGSDVQIEIFRSTRNTCIEFDHVGATD